MGPSWLQWLLKHLLCLPGLAFATVLLLLALGVRGRRRRRPGEPPLINGCIPFFGVFFQMKKNPYKSIQDYQKKYGNIFTLKIIGNYFTFVLDPFQYPLVLKNHKKFSFEKFKCEFVKKIFLVSIKPHMAKELKDSQKDMQSKLLDMSYDLMQNMKHIMKERFLQAKNWETSQLYKFCRSLIFEVTYITFYGKDPGTNSGEVICELLKNFVKFDNEFLSFLSPLPTLSLRTLKNVREKLIQNFSSEHISNMQETSEIIKARKIFLDKFTDLQDHEKAESIINESFRMTSISSNVRFSEEDITLNLGNEDVNLRKGDNIIIYPPFLHYDPEIFEQPEKFKFDRFVEDGKKKTTFFKRGKEVPYFLLPFGSGISKCPGRFLAVLEIKQLLIFLFMYFDLEFIEFKPLEFSNSRILFGIQCPESDISFKYKLRC
ncbi:cytochrome P450 7B1 isoform X2 [Sminthopsis crassicaudata]|uniref:cytochrome P450 7B1 isoform X2 n=1 Tax=Sminthopsis crassicaudata TaxID=9301 RepID=UPI003D680798